MSPLLFLSSESLFPFARQICLPSVRSPSVPLEESTPRSELQMWPEGKIRMLLSLGGTWRVRTPCLFHKRGVRTSFGVAWAGAMHSRPGSFSCCCHCCVPRETGFVSVGLLLCLIPTGTSDFGWKLMDVLCPFAKDAGGYSDSIPSLCP